MSLKKFPVFTFFNVLNILLSGAALALAILRWRGFLKSCPSSSILVDAVYGACGFMIGVGLIGIVATITRSRLWIYFYKFLLFLAFVVAGAFVALTLMMKSGAANFILQFSWSYAPDKVICDFQEQFGCAGWSSACVQGVAIDGCPNCPRAVDVFSFSVDTTTTTSPLSETCRDLFQRFFNDQFVWILIGACSFMGWVVLLNIGAYCAGQQFTLVAIDDDEEHLARRAARVRELERLLAEEEALAARLNAPVNSRSIFPQEKVGLR